MTAIRTPDQRLRIFVSSTMKELASARAAARSALERLRLIPVLFELGARPYPPRDLYLAYLRQSDVFIGIYGQQYGWIAPDQEISGSELRDMFEGVVMVALDEVSSADLVVSSIASSLGIPESPGQPLQDTVINYLRARKLLLIIDNFEHVVTAAGLLGLIISQTDQVLLLVTSRERLRLSGERVVEVPPLQVPEASDHDEALQGSDAVALFIDRASATGSNLYLDHDQLEIIAEICRGLDGIPLAIELAASRTKVVGLEELIRRLDRRLSFLSGGPRDLPVRQQTLRSTIAWSHDLLDDSERRLFARLGVFAAGFPLEAAETVCADDAAPAVPGRHRVASGQESASYAGPPTRTSTLHHASGRPRLRAGAVEWPRRD
jgi:Domain of unknown function (DUF4062)